MLIGRDAETAVLERLLADAREGRSGVLVVRGEAGIGKSALLEHARSRADGMTVLRGIGIESESELAYAAAHQVLRPVLDRIERLPEPQAAALRAAFALSDETVEERFRVSLAVLGLLAEVAEERPMLCLVDDAQWLDQASAEALVFAARRLVTEPVAVLFAARDDPDRTFRAPGLTEIRLGPLDSADARSLVGSRSETELAPEALAWVVDNAEGNPLALVELPGSLTTAQLAGRAPVTGWVPPTTSVEDAYLERVRRLPAATREVLLLAAADETADRATIAVAATALGLDGNALAAAEVDGLVQVDSDRIRFRHPLVRSAVYRAAGFADRERAHRALAAALTSPADADRRAWHRAAATVGVDDDVADELDRTAGRAVARSGWSAASAALERAADLSSTPESRARRLVAAADAAWHGGRPDRATSLLDRAEPIVSDPRLRGELQHVRGVVELRCGSQIEACDILMAAAEDVARFDLSKALQMLLEAREAAGWAGDMARTREAGERAAALPRTDDATTRFLVDLLVGVGRIYDGDTAVGTPLVEDVVARADDVTNPMWLIWAANGARALGDEGRAVALVRRALALARASGEIDTLTYVLLGSALIGFFAGELGNEVHAAQGLTLGREAGLTNATSTHLAMLAWFAAVKGQAEDARAHALEAIALARPRGGGAASSIAEWAIGILELGAGDAGRAVSHLATAGSPQPGTGHPYIGLLAVPDLVEACVRSGGVGEARDAAAVFDAFAQPGSPLWAQALAARCHALSASGNAEKGFSRAVELHVESKRPYDEARTRLLFGEYLRRDRRRREARDHLRSALETFESLGAQPWAERARVELRATGETARKRDPSTIDELTPQELQIARLVGEGSSNKEVAAQLFLSPRTVEYHLRKVFAKLGITSRAELIRQGVGAVREPAVA